MIPSIYQVVANRFSKAFASAFASSLILLPTLTPASWSDVTTYLHALAIALVTALIMALEKTISWDSTPTVNFPVK